MHKLVGVHDSVGSARLRRDNKAVQYSLSYIHTHMPILLTTSQLDLAAGDDLQSNFDGDDDGMMGLTGMMMK
jgi:hypothetical protein